MLQVGSIQQSPKVPQILAVVHNQSPQSYAVSELVWQFGQLITVPQHEPHQRFKQAHWVARGYKPCVAIREDGREAARDENDLLDVPMFFAQGVGCFPVLEEEAALKAPEVMEAALDVDSGGGPEGAEGVVQSVVFHKVWRQLDFLLEVAHHEE